MNSKLQEINEHEPWNERLKRNIRAYYDRLLKPESFTAITRQECEKLKEIGNVIAFFDTP